MDNQKARLYLHLSKDAKSTLETCVKERKFRSIRDYIERLIYDDFNRLKDAETSPDFQPQNVKLDYIIKLLKPVLEQAYLARGLAAHNAIILLSNVPQNRTEAEARELVKAGVASMLETLKQEAKF